MKALRPATAEKSAYIREFPLFRGLSDAVMERLADRSSCMSFARGEKLFLEGDEADGFYLVIEGRVKISKLSPRGREQVLRVFEALEPVGEVPAFEGGAYPADAECLTPVKALHIRRDLFLELSRENPEMLLSMLAILSRRLRNMAEQLSEITGSEVTQRLARFITEQGRDRFALAVSKKLLSSQLGTIPETLSRSFSALEKQGAIRMDGREIEVVDPKKLKNIAEGAGR